MRPTSPAEALLLSASACRDLGLSLELCCWCGRTAVRPFRLMLDERPVLASVALGQIVMRVRCQACAKPPSRVLLINAAEHAAAGYSQPGQAPWELVLFG